MDKAKQYRDDVVKHNSELKEQFGNNANLDVKVVGPFSWLTRDSVAAQPGRPTPTHLTPLPQLDRVGVDFMRTVFSLDLSKPESKTAVAWNDPKTVVYVVQAIEFGPRGKSEDAFRQDFLRWGAMYPNP